MRDDADRVLPRLRQGRVIDNQKASLITDQAIRFLHQGRLKRNTVPYPGGNKMMKLIIADIASLRGYRLNALAVSSMTTATKLVDSARPGSFAAVDLIPRPEP